ncbi:MAG TPA: cytochrome c biogenesis protein CcsA, partial [Bacteroidales bacterium]|nr:cytochrome c biogenesis protein CcsA [Bacteroidales bacterium]
SIFLKGEDLFLVSKDSIQHMDMMANESVAVPPDSIYPLKAMNLYNTGTANIVLKQFMRSAVTKLVSNESLADGMALDAFTAKVSVDGKSGEVNVFGGYGYLARSSEVEIDGVKVSISYGSKVIDLPFRIQVEDFILDRYPGSNSPASYASEVTVIDEERSLVMPYKIYMNNVLNYRGYRFFQSSYDKDEKGTVFSVNHDAPGTIITYIGYLLMTIGMIVTLFYRNSRFSRLLKKAGEVRQSRKTLAMLLLIAGLTGGLSMQAMARGAIDNIPVIDKAHAEAFGTLQVLGSDGRQEPVSTLTSEILRKIARKTSFEGLSPDQVYLGIMAYPQLWNDVPIIKITHPQLKDFLGVEGKYAAFSQIVDLATGEYKIREFVDNAYAKKPSMQSKFDKDVIQVDERVNIYYMVYTGSFLKIFPVKGDNNNSWVASGNSKDMFDEANGIPVRSAFANYIMAIVGAAESGDWSVANEHLEAIRDYQREYGSAIYLSDAKVSMEIFYNKFNIFKRLSMYYGLIGFILLVLHFINILRPKINLRAVIKIGSVLIFLLFLLHTAGLTIRWYISGHAPWSDGYESMIYIAWATALSGLIFVWRSEITLSVTALMASLILAVAGMSWMDPEITNLVPVLKSYWLIIHVAIITASYGFLGLGALLGFLNLVLMIVKSKKSLERVNLTIKELTHINEMTLIIGLVLLTIGTFLGGVWANESWGRYWGWDPKETWALATVGFYSFVVHFRLIPGLKGKFAFNFAALISYGFVLMTYFGVNYYLSGLHSYAS